MLDQELDHAPAQTDDVVIGMPGRVSLQIMDEYGGGRANVNAHDLGGR